MEKVDIYMQAILEYMNYALAVIILGCTSSFVFLLTVWLVSSVDSARKFSDYNEVSENRQWKQGLDFSSEH